MAPSSQSSNIPPAVWEGLAKIGVNILLLTFGVAAIAKIVPHQLSQLQKLTALEAEVHQLEQRVTQLKQEQQRDLQPQAWRRIAQEEANLIAANQRRIIWVQPDTTKRDPQ
ncbi:slr1601 family putative cell division protein [Parathermosynechococcus lividus]